MPDAGGRAPPVGGDISFMVGKSFEGKLVSAEGFLSAAGDLATLTASTGKDMYIARAKITVFNNDQAGNSLVDEVVLKINGTIVETAKGSVSYAANLFVPQWTYEFKNMGHTVAATEIIKIEVIALDATSDVEGFIECFEEDTGADPRF